MALLTADEIIEIAMRLEESGAAFYNAAADRADTEDLRVLFEELAIQEQYHCRVFRQMGSNVLELSLTPDQWDQFLAYADALLQQQFLSSPEKALNLAWQARDEQGALQSALGFERETLLFFQQLREVVRSPEQQTVDRIIREEEQHIERLAGMLAGA